MRKLSCKLFILFVVLCTTVMLSEAIAVEPQKGTISTNASSEKEVAPDIAEITFAVVTNDSKSLQRAVEENKLIFEKLNSVLKSMINPQNGDYIKTLGYTTTPVYSYVNSKKVFDRYDVTNKVLVKTKNVDILGKMIDDAISAGATNIENLNFSLFNYEPYCESLITQATKKAKAQADITAKALFTSITGVQNVNTSCNINNNYNPRLYMAKNMIADTAAGASFSSPTSISNGTIKVSAHINASFYVK